MADQQQDKDIAVVFQGTATKANGSALGFEAGRERGTDNLFLRVTSNDGGGTFTKAWQPVAVLRDALAPYKSEGKPLRFANALGPAIPQKGRNNAPFVGYLLVGIGILGGNEEKPGEYFVAGDWDAWAKSMLALPVPEPSLPTPAETPAEQESGTPQQTSAPAKGKRATKKGTAAASTQGEGKATVIAVGANPTE